MSAVKLPHVGTLPRHEHVPYTTQHASPYTGATARTLGLLALARNRLLDVWLGWDSH